MQFLNRRQAMKLASSFAAAFPLLNSPESRAQIKPGAVVFEMAEFSRIGTGTAVRRCNFHARGHVVVKSPNSVVEECQFAYSSTVALQAGSDIGFWSEAGFADNLTLRNNDFDQSITGANALTEGNGALGTIYIGMSAPEGAKGFANSFQNRNITIQGNRIDNSFIYGIFVGNADGVRIVDNVIGQTFIRGSFDARKFYGETPNSGSFIGRSWTAEISNNSVARGRIAKAAVAVDRTCERQSIRLANNVLARQGREVMHARNWNAGFGSNFSFISSAQHLTRRIGVPCGVAVPRWPEPAGLFR